MSIGLFLVGTSQGLSMLTIGFSLFTLGMMGAYPAVMGIIADTTPEERRGTGYAVYYASTVIGYPLGLIIGLLLAWRTGYSVLGALVLVFTPIAFTIIEKTYKTLPGRTVKSREYKAKEH